MTCSKCHLFNSPRWLRHLWTQHGLDCWPSVAGETCCRSPPHTNTPRERASLSQEGRVLGCQAPLPAVCSELIHQLSQHGVHTLGGALCLQRQVDSLQAGLLRDRRARVRTMSRGQRVHTRPPAKALSPQTQTEKEGTVRAKKVEIDWTHQGLSRLKNPAGLPIK